MTTTLKVQNRTSSPKNKVIDERVEAELKKKEVVAQPASGHQQTALPFSSTQLNKTQNLCTASLPPPKVEPAALPAKPATTQLLPSTSNPQTITSSQSILPTNPPSQLSTTNPFRQAITVTLPAPFQSVPANSQPPAQNLPTKPILKPTTMSLPTPYEALYKSLRTSGRSREDAAAGAKAP